MRLHSEGRKLPAAELRSRLRRDLDVVARRRKLQGYEVPRDFVVDLEPWSKSNHLLTDSGKPSRGKLKAKCVPPVVSQDGTALLWPRDA